MVGCDMVQTFAVFMYKLASVFISLKEMYMMNIIEVDEGGR